MNEQPECFSYVMSSKEFLKSKNITQGDCQICEIKEKCVSAYNGRVYNAYVDEWWTMTEEDLEAQREEDARDWYYDLENPI